MNKQLGLTIAQEKAEIERRITAARREYIAGFETIKSMSEKYGISETALTRISRREKWMEARVQRKHDLELSWRSGDMRLCKLNQIRFLGEAGELSKKLQKLLHLHLDRLTDEAEAGAASGSSFESQVQDLQRIAKATQIWVEISRKNLGMDGPEQENGTQGVILDAEPID